MHLYDFKWREELAWGVATALLTFALSVLTTTDLETVTDWRAWAISTAAGAARVSLAAALNVLLRRRGEQ